MPFRRGDRSVADELPRPRILPLLLALAVVLVAVAYGVPLLSTGDPLWPLPTDVRPDAVAVHWDGSDTRIGPDDRRYPAIVSALNDVLRSIDGIEYSYGLRPDDVAALRSSGRAVEALFGKPTRIHGAYAVGAFTAVLIPLSGPESDLHLVFFGDGGQYRSAPLRTHSLDRLRESARTGRGPALPDRALLGSKQALQ